MIELLVSEICDQVETTQQALQKAMGELRIREPIIFKVIKTYGDARKEKFEGSPEVRIDGEDIDPHMHINFSHKACRTYFFRGKILSSPPKDMIKDAFVRIRGKQ
jgi:hypothetical protein